ncbi:Peroxisome biosynthesis protein pex1, partial [Coemansia sp. RSA 2681]
HFSGADLQALVYNAFLAAVHSEIETSEVTGSNPTETPLPAEFAAIGGNKALLASPAERAKLAERLIRLIHSSTSTNTTSTTATTTTKTTPTAKDRVPVVTMAHFDAAFASTHASLTAADRERFAAIYRAFANSGKKSAVDKQPSRAPIEQRATLA